MIFSYFKNNFYIILIAFIAVNDLEIYQMDVKIIFLYGDLKKEAYMEQPYEFVVNGKKKKENL